MKAAASVRSIAGADAQPLEPATTICLTLLSSLSDCSADLPASSRARLSAVLTRDSNDSRMVMPGNCSSRSCWASSMTFSTSCLAVRMRRVMVAIVSGSAIVSPMPIEKPLWRSQ